MPHFKVEKLDFQLMKPAFRRPAGDDGLYAPKAMQPVKSVVEERTKL